MINGPKLTPGQWKFLASAVSNISQAIILFGLASLFVPQTLSLEVGFSKGFAILILTGGLLLLIGAIIIYKRGR